MQRTTNIVLMLSALAGLAGCTNVTPTAPPDDDPPVGAVRQAATYTTTVPYVGGGCVVCGGQYECLTPTSGGKTFTDPTAAGSLVHTVQVAIYQTGCSAGVATVRLNGTTLGTYQSSNTCVCNSCEPAWIVTYNNNAGVPGYVYGGANTLTINPASGSACVNRAVLTITTGTPKIGVTPTSLAFGNQPVNTTSAQQNITISNTGDAALTISSTATSNSVFTRVGNVPVTINPGASTTLGVTFRPTATGTVTGTLTLNHNAGAPTTVTLSGTGVSASITVSANPLDFGQVPINTSLPQTLQLINNGGATLTVSSLAITGSGAADFSITGVTTPFNVGPGGSYPLPVVFKPTDHGSRFARITIANNSTTPSFPVDLRGVGIGAKIQIIPSSVNFGAANVGTTVQQKITISNQGETDLQVKSLVFSGANAADFTTNATFPIQLAPTAATQITLSFTPPALGNRTASAAIASNDPLVPTVAVPLTGLGGAPMIGANPMMIDFGNVKVGQTSATRTVTVSNTGNAALKITAISLSGADAAQFKANAMAPLTIAAGGSGTIPVQYLPTMGGMANAKLTLMSDDPKTPNVEISLTGTGLAGVLALAPMSIDFGNQLVGRASPPRALELSNTGTAALVISNIMLSGPQAMQFATAKLPMLPLTLMPGDKASFDVALTAGMAGNVEASVSITSDDPAAPLSSVKLTGVGISTLLAGSPTQIDFGTIHVGEMKTSVVTLTNMGADPIQLDDAVVEGGGSASYTVTPVAGMINPGTPVMATVTYKGTVMGSAAATVKFTSPDKTVPPVLVMLSGKAVSSFISVDPTSLDFGLVLVGKKSDIKNVRITNNTSQTVTVSEIKSESADFVVEPGMATQPIMPGGFVSFGVAFQPKTGAKVTSKVSLKLSGGMTAEATVDVTGIGQLSGGSGGGGGCTVSGRAVADDGPRALALCAALIAACALLLRRRRA